MRPLRPQKKPQMRRLLRPRMQRRSPPRQPLRRPTILRWKVEVVTKAEDSIQFVVFWRKSGTNWWLPSNLGVEVWVEVGHNRKTDRQMVPPRRRQAHRRVPPRFQRKRWSERQIYHHLLCHRIWEVKAKVALIHQLNSEKKKDTGLFRPLGKRIFNPFKSAKRH